MVINLFSGNVTLRVRLPRRRHFAFRSCYDVMIEVRFTRLVSITQSHHRGCPSSRHSISNAINILGTNPTSVTRISTCSEAQSSRVSPQHQTTPRYIYLQRTCAKCIRSPHMTPTPLQRCRISKNSTLTSIAITRISTFDHKHALLAHVKRDLFPEQVPTVAARNNREQWVATQFCTMVVALSTQRRGIGNLALTFCIQLAKRKHSKVSLMEYLRLYRPCWRGLCRVR
ncbi:hypothetical protein BDN71DRAFT_354471 [Pleurotus eryngii]|uniref:Uncharacterized protein n=1 Tax=Pleurotus eryngii TaxID=5323 RepID=A0A9P6A7S7_PLEER|nr:hypothetical protein BDN71DRAFT_354471 [Pleurotus eryngii]